MSPRTPSRQIVTRGGLPALNVKVYRVDWPSPRELAERSGCTEARAAKALENVWEAAQADFWDVRAPDSARHWFGAQAAVYSAGRSSGWLTVDGLKPPADWTPSDWRKWGGFVREIQTQITEYKSAEWAEEMIEANDWLTEPVTEAEKIAALTAALGEMLADAETLQEPYRNEAICERARAALALADGIRPTPTTPEVTP